MTELITAAQMRAIEADAIASSRVTGLELMERAGRGVVEAIFEEWPDLAATSHKAVVLCGPGNNGGDGFVVARLLKECGWEVEVFFYGDAEKLPPDARVNYERWMAMGEVAPYSEDTFGLDPEVWDTDTLLIDALFGTGLTRPVSDCNEVGWVTQITEWSLSADNRSAAFPGCRCVSVDIPSGLDADSGRVLFDDHPHREVISAHLTVTFHCAKLGHFLDDGPQHCGKLIVKDIGLKRRETSQTGQGTKAGLNQ